ncbi:glycosyltransferase [Micromonospora haikouensis]|uniref:glycosyltransferase n=1 Tax=Micromonospora haikouensis TaxID=686309 RepID=UPI0037B302A1
MRVLLSTFGGRGDVEPLVGLAIALREAGAGVRVCAPPDCAERLDQFGVELVPIGQSVREMVHGPAPTTVPDVPRKAAELMAEQFAELPAAAEGCDVMVATGLFPVTASVQSVAERLGIRYVYAAYCPIFLPSPAHRPQPAPTRPLPPDVTDWKELDALAIEGYNAVFGAALNRERAALGLSPVDNVRDHVFTADPWLAADPTLAPWPADAANPVDVVQTGAWMVPDPHPLDPGLKAFLDAGDPPVYVGFGSMPAPQHAAEVALAAIRAHGRRAVVSRGWAGLTPSASADDVRVVAEVNHRALFRRCAAVVHHGGAGTTTTAALTGAPQVLVPQMADQPYFAARVAALGIGAAHSGPSPTVESLAAALGQALSPETRSRAAATAATIRPDGAAVAAHLILGL